MLFSLCLFLLLYYFCIFCFYIDLLIDYELARKLGAGGGSSASTDVVKDYVLALQLQQQFDQETSSRPSLRNNNNNNKAKTQIQKDEELARKLQAEEDE